MIPKRGEKEQANLRLRFIELLLLIATLLVTLTDNLGDITNAVFLGFIVFSVTTYVFLIHRIKTDKFPVLAFGTGLTFAWIFSAILIYEEFQMYDLTFSLIYFLLVGLIVSGGLVSTKKFSNWIERIPYL